MAKNSISTMDCSDVNVAKLVDHVEKLHQIAWNDGDRKIVGRIFLFSEFYIYLIFSPFQIR